MTRYFSTYSELSDWINTEGFSKILILTDTHTHQACLPILQPELSVRVPIEIIEIEAGEENKNLDTATQLWEIFSEFHLDRKGLILNLGGGMICDLGGFVASTYKRGISFVHIPTTLLSLCDACIGGKTGVDLGILKNMVGTFVHPDAVLTRPEFLASLPMEEFRAGLAEMLKHGLVAEESHWKALTNLTDFSLENFTPLISESQNIKKQIIEKDFYEKNIRKTLNFGHTVGHALESAWLSISPKLHGECIAIGMIIEAVISNIQNNLRQNHLDEIIGFISGVFPMHPLPLSNEDLYQLMLNDKKNEEESIRMALLSKIGICNTDQKVSKENIFRALDFYRGIKI